MVMNVRRADQWPVLHLTQAQLRSAGQGVERMFLVDLTLLAGDFLLVHASDPGQAAVLANACVGLSAPLSGSVSLLGEDWNRVDDNAAVALRARVGRHFADGIWLEQLNVLENMILAQAHHTDLPLAELQALAGRHARAFGLPGAPTSRPEDCPACDLLRAACAAAFMGNPALIILEYPTRDHYAGVTTALMIAIRRARRRGAAILWLTREEELWSDPTIPATAHARLFGHELVEVDR
jgi:phospholipid/cholesterol/gamma-HCH transport system ATP-binding protein